VPAVEVAGV